MHEPVSMIRAQNFQIIVTPYGGITSGGTTSGGTSSGGTTSGGTTSGGTTSGGTNTQADIYFENGTCKCPNASAGDTAVINGTTYTVVNNDTLKTEWYNQNGNLCTTLVTSMNSLSNSSPPAPTVCGNCAPDWAYLSVYGPLGDINFWDTSNVTDMSYAFSGIPFNMPIGNWNTSNVTDMAGMFMENSAFREDISSWDVSNVTNMRAMFRNAFMFNQDLTGWCVTNASVSGVYEPGYFSYMAYNTPLGTGMSDTNKPVWGTCPGG